MSCDKNNSDMNTLDKNIYVENEMNGWEEQNEDGYFDAILPVVDKTNHSITMNTAGTITEELIFEAMDGGRSLKVSGPVNGADMKLIRLMCGCCLDEEQIYTPEECILYLDLKDALIRKSKHAYYVNSFVDDILCINQNNVIPDYMFENSYLQELILPDTITKIGIGAISLSYSHDAKSLQSIVIPASVDSICINAFGYQDALTSITFTPSSKLTYIGPTVFSDCKALEHIEIPEGVVTIGDDIFYKCNNLKNVTIPSTIRNIDVLYYGYLFRNLPSVINIKYLPPKGAITNVSIEDQLTGDSYNVKYNLINLTLDKSWFVDDPEVPSRKAVEGNNVSWIGKTWKSITKYN